MSAYDYGNQYTVPYASGITGIAYDPERVGREITSIKDLWDPEFKGRVGMMRDPQEISNFALLYNGVAPEDSTPEDWLRTCGVSLRVGRGGRSLRIVLAEDNVRLCEGLIGHEVAPAF